MNHLREFIYRVNCLKKKRTTLGGVVYNNCLAIEGLIDKINNSTKEEEKSNYLEQIQEYCMDMRVNLEEFP